MMIIILCEILAIPFEEYHFWTIANGTLYLSVPIRFY